MHLFPPVPQQVPRGVIPYISRAFGDAPLSSKILQHSGDSSGLIEAFLSSLPPNYPHADI